MFFGETYTLNTKGLLKLVSSYSIIQTVKIIYCIDSLISSGGTERVTSSKVNWLSAKKDIQVYVVTLQETTPPFFPLAEQVNRIMLNVRTGDRRSYKQELANWLTRIQPDITIAVAGMSVDVLPKLKDGSKKILEFHYTKNFLVNFVKGLHTIRFRRLHLLKMYWLQWKLAQQAKRYDCFVGLTKRDVGLWGNPANMTYIHNPLSFRSEKQSTCEHKRIIAVGSWTPAKGMDQLLEAFGRIASKYPDWHVELYGSGQDKNLLLNIVRKYHMETQVTLHAPCQTIKEKLVESAIYAFPSRSDGFGLVITEAMECGLPTVAMDCECGPCEIVTDDTGIVVPDKDITAFSQALERLMKDEALRKTMGQNARQQVKRFYPDAIMPKWVELFADILKKQK